MSNLGDEIAAGFKSIFGGGSSKKIPKSGGHVLGSTAPPPAAAPGQPFTITFEQQSLGLSLTRDDATGRAVVSDVVEGGEGWQAGVKLGDALVEVEGNHCPRFEDVAPVLQSMPRPVRVGFRAVQRTQQRKSSSGMGTMFAPSGSKKQPSQAELDSRRAQALKAAESRGAAWDKKLNVNRTNKARQEQAEKERQEQLRAAQDRPISAETQKAFTAAQQKEAKTAQQLGYNPYAPHISSSAASRAATTTAQAAQQNSDGVHDGAATPSPPPADLAAPNDNFMDAAQPHEVSGGAVGEQSAAAEVSPQVEVQLFEALALVRSQEESVVCDLVATVCKLLANLVANFKEEKFHKVRLANKTFHRKVGSVAGGLDVMLAAGFILTNDASDDNVLEFPNGPTPPPPLLHALQQLEQLRRELPTAPS